MTDEEIYVQYKNVWPDKDEANLREYVYYQRIIHDSKKQKKKLVRERIIEDPESENDDEWVSSKIN